MNGVMQVMRGLARGIGRMLSAWGGVFSKRGCLGRLVWVAVTLAGLACACFTLLTGTVIAGQTVGLIPRITATPTWDVAVVRSTQVVPLGETESEPATLRATATEPEVTAAATATVLATATARPPTATSVPATVTLGAPTATPAPPTSVPATATALPPVLVDTATAPPPLPTDTAPAPVGARVVIVAVNKGEEFVDIQNQGDQAQDLGGWRLVSETGNQACALGGVLEPGATLRIWAMTGPGGFNCNFGRNIWNNDDPDPAVLYNAQGQEVSRR